MEGRGRWRFRRELGLRACPSQLRPRAKAQGGGAWNCHLGPLAGGWEWGKLGGLASSRAVWGPPSRAGTLEEREAQEASVWWLGGRRPQKARGGGSELRASAWRLAGGVGLLPPVGVSTSDGRGEGQGRRAACLLPGAPTCPPRFGRPVSPAWALGQEGKLTMVLPAGGRAGAHTECPLHTRHCLHYSPARWVPSGRASAETRVAQPSPECPEPRGWGLGASPPTPSPPRREP